MAQEENRQLHSAAVRMRVVLTGVVSRNKELHALAAEQAARCDSMSVLARERDDTILALNEQVRFCARMYLCSMLTLS
jgi:hypothetical protein